MGVNAAMRRRARCVLLLAFMHGPWAQTVTRGHLVDNIHKSYLCSYLGVYSWVPGLLGGRVRWYSSLPSVGKTDLVVVAANPPNFRLYFATLTWSHHVT